MRALESHSPRVCISLSLSLALARMRVPPIHQRRVCVMRVENVRRDTHRNCAFSPVPETRRRPDDDVVLLMMMMIMMRVE